MSTPDHDAARAGDRKGKPPAASDGAKTEDVAETVDNLTGDLWQSLVRLLDDKKHEAEPGPDLTPEEKAHAKALAQEALRKIREEARGRRGDGNLGNGS